MSNSLTKLKIHKKLTQTDKENIYKILMLWNLFIDLKLNANNLEQVMKICWSRPTRNIRI